MHICDWICENCHNKTQNPVYYWITYVAKSIHFQSTLIKLMYVARSAFFTAVSWPCQATGIHDVGLGANGEH